jgi:hypothetical protein
MAPVPVLDAQPLAQVAQDLCLVRHASDGVQIGFAGECFPHGTIAIGLVEA